MSRYLHSQAWMPADCNSAWRSGRADFSQQTV
nr:MAG TPA: hypothetical protein [Caudoviricetes sp.]